MAVAAKHRPDNESKLRFRAQLLRGGVAGALARLGAVLAGLIASVTLARFLGPETYGIYAFVFSVITLIGLPVKMGLPTLILRETARADQANDEGLMKGIWLWSDRAIALMAVLVVGAVALYLWLAPSNHTPRMQAMFWALPLVPLIGWAQARSAAIRGLRHVALGTVPDKVFRPLLLAMVVALVTLTFGAPLSAAHVFAIHGGVAFVALLLANVILQRTAPKYGATQQISTKSRAWITAILPLTAIAGLREISHNTDILMLGTLATDADVGIYRVALSVSNMAIFGLTTVILVLQPYFAQAWSGRDHHRLQQLASVGARVSVLTTLPFLLLFLVAGTSLLTLIFGDEYAEAFWPLIILCVGQSFSSFFGLNGTLLTMSGREWIALSGLAVSTVVNIGLNWVLIPAYGVQGAAMATGISIATWNLCLWAASWFLLRIDTTAIGLRRTPPANIGPREEV